MQKILNTFIESLLIFVAIFTPIAFGTVHIWSISIMEFAILLAAFIWFFNLIREGKLVFVKTYLNTSIIIFIVLTIIQYLAGRITSGRFGTIYPYATRVYFFEILSYILVFLIIVNNIHKRTQINRIIISMIAVGAALSIYGIIQKLAGATKIFWFKTASEVLIFYSSYFNCNYFAGYLSLIIFLMLGAFFAYLFYLNKKRNFNKFNIFEGWTSLFIFSIAMTIASLFYTFSQGGIIVFIIILIFFYILFLRRVVPENRILIIILVSIITLATWCLIWVQREKTLDYFYEILKILKEINTYGLRIPVWVRALSLIKDHPLIGTGLGTFVYAFPKYRPNYHMLWLHCHNDYLELLTETGFIGFLTFLFGMFFFFKRYITLLNTRRDSYVKAMGYGCLASLFSIFLYSFIEANMHIGANALVFSYILALGFVVIHNSSNAQGEEKMIFKTITFTIKSIPRKIAFFLIVLSAFLYFAANVVSICAASIYASIGKDKDNIEYIKTAIKLEPLSSDYHVLLADVMLEGYKEKRTKKDALKLVIDELKEAIRLNPSISAYRLKLALIYSHIGDKEKAIKEFRIAQELEPLDPFNYLLLAIHYFNEAAKVKGVNLYGSKDMEDGVAEYRKALSIDPYLIIDKYKNNIRDYLRIKEILQKYSL